MSKDKKITVTVPTALLRKAQAYTKQGITLTIRQGLALLAAGGAYEGLRRLRGTVRFSLDFKHLRDDK